MEYVAAAHNDSLLCLDELKTAKPYEVSDIIYRLANSVGKARLDKEINLRAPATWRALWISTGELTVSQYVEQAGYTAQAGTDIRSIPIDVGMGVRVNPTDKDTLGIFEEVPPGFKKISEAFNLLSAGTRENFGVLGFKWLEYLTANAKAVKAQAELFARGFDEKAPKEIGAQQSRELNRFKLCAVAGEIATKAGLTGWHEGQATAAVIRLMERYFEGLYGTNERAEYGYRNFNLYGFSTYAEGDDGQEDLAERQTTPVNPELKQKRIMFFDTAFRKLIGNYSVKSACEELILRGLLVQNDKYPN